MSADTRLAFFTDSFHEANGVARTSRRLYAFAHEHQLPLLCVCCGDRERSFDDGSVRVVQLRRGPVSVRLEHDLAHDLLLWRYAPRVRAELDAFAADVVHITSPADVGQLGTWLAYRLGLPLVAAWTTNLHQFAARRVVRPLAWAPSAVRRTIERAAERWTLAATLRFYGDLPRLVLAPTTELQDLLQQMLGKPVHVMRRGVDVGLFDPARRCRTDSDVVLGFVGRLSSEKNVRLLARLEQELLASGRPGFRFLIVGDGGERRWLERNLRNAKLTGVLRAEELARAYASMDIFVFPSRTETFGNVVLEALASGVPAVVTDEGGPRHIVQHGVTGMVASSDAELMASVVSLMDDPEARARLGRAARDYALTVSWEGVFERLWAAYRFPHEGRETMPLPATG